MFNSKCKKCRAAGEKLFLKGERCFGQKCAMVKRPNPPGIHGKRKKRSISEYGRQLAEKQKIKRIYGILERQFKKYAKEAMAKEGDSRELLMKKLEMRLDNVVFRLGWAKSRTMAKQLVSHGHILVDGKRVNISSFRVRKGQIILLSEKIKKSNLMKDMEVVIKKYETLSWLALDKEKIEGKILDEPGPQDLGDLTQVGLVIEFYSK